MENFRKPVFLILIVFLNLTTFSNSRATILGNHNPKGVGTHKPHVKRVEYARFDNPKLHHGSSGNHQSIKAGRDDQEGDVSLNGLTQGSYGDSYGSGYDTPYQGGIFGFPRGLFGGFPRGMFRFPRGIFGFPSFGNPGVYGVNPGGYGGYPGGYGRYPGGRDKPGGGGYGGKPKVKGK